MRTWRSFDATRRLLMVNQFTINVAFYLLMPFLAGTCPAAWAWRAGPSGWCSACATSAGRPAWAGGYAAGVHLLGRSGPTRPLPWAHG